jgi:hypothetical protein
VTSETERQSRSDATASPPPLSMRNTTPRTRSSFRISSKSSR